MTQRKNTFVKTWTDEENNLLISLYNIRESGAPLTYLEIARQWNQMYREGKVGSTKNEDSIRKQITYLINNKMVVPVDRSGNPHMRGKVYINRRGN